MRRLLGLLVAVFLALFVVALAPHLVHHAFDDDHAVQRDCPFTTIADRQHPDTPVVTAFEHGGDHVATIVATGESTVASRAVVVTAARAPPTASS